MTLGIELEFEAQEKEVGPFRADILCKDMGTDSDGCWSKTNLSGPITHISDNY